MDKLVPHAAHFAPRHAGMRIRYVHRDFLCRLSDDLEAPYDGVHGPLIGGESLEVHSRDKYFDVADGFENVLRIIQVFALGRHGT